MMTHMKALEMGGRSDRALRSAGGTMRIVGHRIKLRKDHMVLMQIPRRFWDASFDAIPDCKGRVPLRNYLREIEPMLDNGSGLLIFGPNGTGKTSAAIVIAKEARRLGASVLFVQAEEFRQGVIDKTMFSDEQTLYERAKEVDMLVLDDLGKEHSGDSGYAERLFENLIRLRTSNKKVTVITTNLIPKPPDDDRTKPALSNRYVPSMLELMKESMYPVNLVGRDWRVDSQRELEARLTG